ncbi:Crp/Fnr family transcriptional regulator [Rivibacter subsaxonicus]|uniref:CRP-like cAMP-binding protein n=1 Tax=Rivibacter subsaxonicus TaxID=457575 RepID=A0A4Q7W233_9BURK|nr:Crp/Fnr family transcriptional regulator [Rivibacter subsaxonicus]RZU02945.1 CRP-like cAMP-binding protein [Rivibacter subsaxonicus]
MQPAEISSFADVSMPESLRLLAERAELRRYRKGTLLIEEGDRGDTLYIILAGSLRAFAIGERDREITYGVYGPGEYIGEMSLDGGPRSASVIALEASVCAVVTQTTLLAFIAERPAFALELIAKLIRRARSATLSAKQLALNDVYGRLAALLNALSVALPEGGRRVEERLTHRELASRLGCSREMVSRLMKDLETGGFVATDGAGLRLLRALPARW